MATSDEREEDGRAGGSAEREEPHDLSGLLERMGEASKEGGKVSLGAVLDAVGHRSFGPILLAAGIFTVLPGPADIPGVPTLALIAHAVMLGAVGVVVYNLI